MAAAESGARKIVGCNRPEAKRFALTRDKQDTDLCHHCAQDLQSTQCHVQTTHAVSVHDQQSIACGIVDHLGQGGEQFFPHIHLATQNGQLADDRTLPAFTRQ